MSEAATQLMPTLLALPPEVRLELAELLQDSVPFEIDAAPKCGFASSYRPARLRVPDANRTTSPKVDVSESISASDVRSMIASMSPVDLLIEVTEVTPASAAVRSLRIATMAAFG